MNLLAILRNVVFENSDFNCLQRTKPDCAIAGLSKIPPSLIRCSGNIARSISMDMGTIVSPDYIDDLTLAAQIRNWMESQHIVLIWPFPFPRTPTHLDMASFGDHSDGIKTASTQPLTNKPWQHSSRLMSSRLITSCITSILQEWNFGSSCKFFGKFEQTFLLKLMVAESWGDSMTSSNTVGIFWGVPLLVLPVCFAFNVDSISLKLVTYVIIVFLPITLAFLLNS